jgi:CHAT domain-containing protein
MARFAGTRYRTPAALVCSLSLCYTLWCISAVWGTAARTLSPADLIAAGQRALQQGDLEHAAVKWREAARLAADTQQLQVYSVALTHLAHAYEALGHYSQAAQSLQQALRLAEKQADHTQIATILGSLGNIALAQGQQEEAERLLRQALSMAHDLQNAGLTAVVLHNLGNLFMSQHKLADAFEVYQNSARLAQEAQQFGMAGRALAHAAIAAERDGQALLSRPLLDEARTLLQRVEPSHDTAYELLLIGQAYQRLASTDASLLRAAAAVFHSAADIAQTLQDARALAYAWGYLGRLYEATQQYAEALQLTRQAVLAAQQAHLPAVLYLWQWQSGRLLRARGDLQAAIAAYARAIATVQTLRPALLHTYGGALTSFRTSLGPLYFELVDLFLQHAAALEAAPQAAIYPQYEYYLDRARDIVEQFKTAELRDYFRDECVDAARPGVTALERVSPEALIVYPILLPDRTELLISLPTGLKRVAAPVTGPQLEQRVRVFRQALDDRDPRRYMRHARQLYTWLIQPLVADLTASSVQTIVFVPDGALRTLPLAALHDGRQFLIEKYALAITPSLSLTEPRPLPRYRVQVLAAGVAAAVDNFPPLPRVTEELRRIQALYGGAMLLDEEFNPESLDRAVRRGDFGIVHIASHGQFAAEAGQSFLLTAHGKLTLDQLAQIVGRLRFRAQPLELLTLSACETAQGDDRAALGLAGVSIKAGARSALATLWLVADEAASLLMTEFYRHLQTPGTSRAHALQQAQLTLLRQSQYAEPFFWAPFLLINNWL